MTSRNVSVVLFEDFELLDVCGPVELLRLLPDEFPVRLLGPATGPVRSKQGMRVLADEAWAEASEPDIVLVPGGIGARALVADPEFLAWLATYVEPAELVTSVCTGSAVLAAAGLLEGYRATSNKRAFDWVSKQGTNVTWVPRARWVQDRDRWTSSGVAAGMDMTAALIAALHGREAAEQAANRIELELHTDPSWDPFARLNGLV